MIDAHMHLPDRGKDASEKIHILRQEMKAHNIEKGLLYLIDEKDYELGVYKLDFGKEIIPSIALDFRDVDIEKKLDHVHGSGINSVKILPYEQKIYYEQYDKVCDYAMKVQERSMILTICGAYGSKDVFRTNGVELAARILNAGFTNPLIVAHGGMVRQLEIHSLMCEFDNLYVDTSFTIPYWWGSHVIDDLYFLLEKDNYCHAFWGSDYPGHSFELSQKYFDLFCEKYHISDENRKKLMSDNFNNFYEEYLK